MDQMDKRVVLNKKEHKKKHMLAAIRLVVTAANSELFLKISPTILQMHTEGEGCALAMTLLLKKLAEHKAHPGHAEKQKNIQMTVIAIRKGYHLGCNNEHSIHLGLLFDETIVKIAYELGLLSNADLFHMKQQFIEKDSRSAASEGRVVRFIDRTASTPKSLKGLAALAVSKAVGPGEDRAKKFSQLPLSKIFLSELMFQNVAQLVQKL